VVRGVLERSANPADLRSSAVEISEAGRRMLEQGRQGNISYLAGSIDKLRAEERHTPGRVVVLERLERLP
jgi:DNA-binding MarR family transcriptional regulator